MPQGRESLQRWGCISSCAQVHPPQGAASWANRVTSAPLPCLTHPPHIHTLSSRTLSQQELFSTQCHRLKREDQEEHKNTESPCFFSTDLIRKKFKNSDPKYDEWNSLITFCSTQVIKHCQPGKWLGLNLAQPSVTISGSASYLQWGYWPTETPNIHQLME